MPEEVTVREDLQIIQVISHGNVSAKDLMGSLETVARIHEERGLSAGGFSKVFLEGLRMAEIGIPFGWSWVVSIHRSGGGTRITSSLPYGSLSRRESGKMRQNPNSAAREMMVETKLRKRRSC